MNAPSYNAPSYARSGPSASSSPATFYALIGGMARWLVHGSTRAVLPMQRTNLRQMQDVRSTETLLERVSIPVAGKKPGGPVKPNLVRVIRLQEPGQLRASVGRMVMSGRMADVCAELDRLVAREAALH